ncbi:Protein CBG26373 [Caenorhabditis briggsae]|uniref:Protein CBG26373 n=1 Tax=Caenorhabditis briggsae TaxID=6238 RepID=B6IG39_CAEBR|nr:Protein CBG26373 [Caenorhabditis briggsae]CAR98869.1 Protein CBG26373 [Caenorhabditis briggsae]
MEPKEILLLSFCSKRVQKCIKQQFRIEFNKGFRITCGMNDPRMYHWQNEDEKRLELIVDQKENDKKVINWKYVYSLDSLDLLKEFKYLEEKYSYEACDIDLKSGFIFEINRLRCKCSISFDPNSAIPTLYFEKDLMKKWPMELHKYCVELFRTTSELEMIMNLKDSSDLHESQTTSSVFTQFSQKFQTIWEYRFGQGCRFLNLPSFWPNELDCSDAFDIVRESDGFIASVKVDFGIFFMFVWHSRFS